jgi:hypothetical protein
MSFQAGLRLAAFDSDIVLMLAGLREIVCGLDLAFEPPIVGGHA